MTVNYQPRVPEEGRYASFWTYQDAVEWLLDFYSRRPGGRDERLARRAVLEAYDQIAGSHDWRWYSAVLNLLTEGEYREGTVAYDHATRTVELTGGTWPAGAAWGTIWFDNVGCLVTERTDDTHLVLGRGQTPGKDLEAGTSYRWTRASYPLPPDFLKIADPMDDTRGLAIPGLIYHEPEVFWRGSKWNMPVAVGEPQTYTVDRDPRTTGFSLVFGQAPLTARNYSFRYDRAPRPLRIAQYAVGSIDTTSGSVTVGGNGTSWNGQHVGCVLRISSTNDLPPTSPYGNVQDIDNPARETRLVVAVAEGSELTVDVALEQTGEGLLYSLSDPLDLDWLIAGRAFQRLAEYHFAITTNDVERSADKRRQADRALTEAKGNDNLRSIEAQPHPWYRSWPAMTSATIETRNPGPVV